MRTARPWTYRPELDGVRGIAILAVLVFHSQIWFPHLRADGGALGVDLFFVLSGFLITSHLTVEHDSSKTIDKGRFYARRAVRLLPALGLGLILGAIVTHMTHGNGAGMFPYPRAALVALAFAGNWFQYKIGALGHTWSLGLEEQYYLLWPFVLAWGLRRRTSTLRLAVVLGAGAVAFAAIRSVSNHVSDLNPTLWTTLHAWSHADGLFIGSVLALLLRSRHAGEAARLLRDPRLAAAALICACAISTRAVLANPTTYDLLFPLDCCFALLIGYLYVRPDHSAGRVLRSEPLLSIGTISYGLYIFHWPLFYLTSHTISSASLAAAAAWGLSISVAVLSYVLVEEPALRLKAKMASARRGRPKVATTQRSLGRTAPARARAA
jgi:peptidoglycan/LPS O-acetylase OafA/YrhL